MKTLEKILLSISLLITVTYGVLRYLKADFMHEALLLSHLSISIVAGFYLFNKKFSISTIAIMSFLIYPFGNIFRMFHLPLATALTPIGFIATSLASYSLFINTKSMKQGNRLTDLCFILLGVLSLSHVLVLFLPFDTLYLLQIVWLMILFTSLFYLQFSDNSRNDGDSVSIIKLLLVNSFSPSIIVITDLISV